MFQAIVAIIVSLLSFGWLIIRSKEEKSKFVNIGWKLLFISGLLFVPGGIAWLIRWVPTPGPYMVGQIYPYGGHVEAWQVSMGFAFAAFGILFSGFAVSAQNNKKVWSWVLLLVSWGLLMFPHIWIGVTFMIDDPTLANLGVSAYMIPFFLTWSIMTGIGFIVTGKDVFTNRAESKRNINEPGSREVSR